MMDTGGEQLVVALDGKSDHDRGQLRVLHQVMRLLLGETAHPAPLEELAALIPAALPSGLQARASIRIGAAVYGPLLPEDLPRLVARFSAAADETASVEITGIPGIEFPAGAQDLLNSIARMLETFLLHHETRPPLLPDGVREFERALKEMADSVAVHTGLTYHAALVKYLSSHFGLNIALVGMLDESGENVQSLVIAEDGVLLPNMSYALAGTPCHDVVRDNACFYGERIQEYFPDDAWFRKVGAHGYAGIRLRDDDGKTLGIVSAISKAPLPNIASIQSFFKLAAARASAELDRTRRIAEVEASERRYSLAESGTADGLWDLDIAAGRVYYSPRVSELLGLSERLGDRPEEFWSRTHPEDLAYARARRDEHLAKNTPLDFQCRVRHADGTYRWFRVRGKALRDIKGAPMRLTGTLTDITEGKRQQAQLAAENVWLAKFAESPSLEELLETIAATASGLFEDAALDLWLLDATGELHIFPAGDAPRFDAECLRGLLTTRSKDAVTLTRGMPGWPYGPGGSGDDDAAIFSEIDIVFVNVEAIPQRIGIAVSRPAGLPRQSHEQRFAAAAAHLLQLALNHLRKEADLERQRLLFENLFECTPEAMVILDRNDCVLNANPGFNALFQYGIDEIRGRPLNELVVPPEFAREGKELSAGAMRGNTVIRESFRRRKDGTLVPVSILGAPVTVNGIDASYFAVYRDQSTLHEATRRLEHQARHDQLTGLPDRYEFERRLKQAMALSADGHGSTGVVYFDLDQFKLVNDTTGHTHGDELLNEVVRRLRPLVPAPYLLARLGGDEFGVLLVNGRLADCEQLAQQVRDRLGAEAFKLGDRTFAVTASFGVVAVAAGTQSSPQEVLSLADSACFLAKERGRNRVQVYDPADMGVTQRREEMDWVSRLNEALLEQRFQLHHQRIASVDGATDFGHYEILLRMIDSNGKLVPPGVFIPPAERYNLMPRIDRWVFERVFSRLDALGSAAQENLLVAINISGNTLNDESLPDFVRRLFEEHDVRPECICFEITETAAIANFDDALAFIDVLRELGCKVALDDFGSGLSSFRYLKQIAPDFLKIDGSFVREIARNRTDYSMVEAINRIGKIIGIRTVAEFVEDDSILEALRQIGVDYAQGYALHRPEPWKHEIQPLSGLPAP
ncbi:MAG TPA: EAL domain-containing protein [Gammaproteobacteria bacterium]